MSKEIYDAILKIRKNVPSIKHDADNKHDSYTYVSIDRYYTGVASIVSKEGLVWRTRETGFELLSDMGKNKDRTFLKASFAYDLHMGDAKVEDYMKVTIVAPMTGAQSTGTVYSYAEKVFMRVAFCVATGEEDADHGQQERGGIKSDDFMSVPTKAQKPAPIPEPVQSSSNGFDPDTGEIHGETVELPMDQAALAPKYVDGLPIIDTRKINQDAAVLIEKIFQTFMPLVKTKAALREWHTENLAAKEKVKRIDPNVGDRISQMFADKNQELSK